MQVAVTILAFLCAVTTGAVLFLTAANAQLRRLLAVREAELRQVKLELGHVEDVAKFQNAPIAESAGVLTEAGLLKPGGILGKRKAPLVVAALLSLGVAIPARAAERLPIGTAISTTAGEILILEDEHLLVDRAEVANLAVMVRDLERCRAALTECDATGKPIAPPATPSSSRLGWWVAAITGAFVAGYAANEYVSHEEPR